MYRPSLTSGHFHEKSVREIGLPVTEVKVPMTEPTFDQLEHCFVAADFRAVKSSEPNARILFQKIVRKGYEPGLPVCLTNDKLMFNATVYEMNFPGDENPYRKVSFDITGEYREDRWTALTVYSVPWEQAIEELERIQRELLVAWDAICAVGR
jgi:hypothetical protein